MDLLLRLEQRRVVGRRIGFAHAASAHFVLGDLADRILRRDGESVGALIAGPVIRYEYCVWSNRRDDHRAQCDGAASGFPDGPRAIRHPEPLREARMHLDAWLGILRHERPDAPCLGARQKLTDDTPRGEENGELVTHIVY